MGSLVSLKRAFGTPEDPPEKYIEETFHNDDGSCFACWSDPNGSYQVICPAEMYWTYCFPDPNGEADCQEFQDHFCDESSYSCYPDGEMCY